MYYIRIGGSVQNLTVLIAAYDVEEENNDVEPNSYPKDMQDDEDNSKTEMVEEKVAERQDDKDDNWQKEVEENQICISLSDNANGLGNRQAEDEKENEESNGERQQRRE